MHSSICTYIYTYALYCTALIEIPLSSGNATASFGQPMRKENEKNQGETERWKSAAATKFIGNTQGGKNNKTLTQYPAYGHNFYAASSEETKKKTVQIDRLGSAYSSWSRSRSKSRELSLQSQSTTCRVFHYELLLTMFHFSWAHS